MAHGKYSRGFCEHCDEHSGPITCNFFTICISVNCWMKTVHHMHGIRRSRGKKQPTWNSDKSCNTNHNSKHCACHLTRICEIQVLWLWLPELWGLVHHSGRHCLEPRVNLDQEHRYGPVGWFSALYTSFTMSIEWTNGYTTRQVAIKLWPRIGCQSGEFPWTPFTWCLCSLETTDCQLKC